MLSAKLKALPSSPLFLIFKYDTGSRVGNIHSGENLTMSPTFSYNHNAFNIGNAFNCITPDDK